MTDNTPASSNRDPLAALAGGGEMGRRLRALDWSGTPLGSIAGWPQSLRSALSICLNSNFPIAIYWGSDLVLLYNDEWSPIPGEKHPRVLGQPAREAWPEIWHILAPLFERVMTTGEATRSRDQLLPMHRHGFTEECYFDYTLSPIRGEGGKVEGVFNAVLETTTRVIGERRLRTLRELGAWKTNEARTAAQACEKITHILAENPHDLPFALLYLLDCGRRPTLVGRTGLERDTSASPATVDLDAPNAPWPFRLVSESGKAIVFEDLPLRFGPLPGGAWPEPPRRAVILPVARSGQSELAGFVVAGISPRLALGDDYRGFLDLLAGHVAAAVASASAYEEERRRAEALAELDRAKTAFFSNVSHEFRTPLALMLGPAEDALTDSTLTATQRERIEVIHRNGLRLQRLVNTLLDFSRIEAGRVRATFELTELATFTADLASNFRSACEKAGLTFTVECPPLGEPVFVDRPMWEKIVLNLLSNAFKFTLEGEIAVSLRRQGDSVELRVRDTGTGIPAEEMPRLFERFHRVENTRGRTHEGSGIGLALVQELVRLHGGAIAAASEVGEGTTFTVTLPLGAEHLPPEQVRRGPAVRVPTTTVNAFVQEALHWLPLDDSGAEAPPFRDDLGPPMPDAERTIGDRPHILVADDNADMRRYVARLLSGPFTVDAVPDGQAALDAVQRTRPDLILSDVMMPRLDGFGLLRKLRADPATAAIPVILLSARAGEESRVEGVEAGADDYLVKPFSARELLARVTAQVQMARLRRETAEAIRQSEERFRLFMNNSPTTAYIKDAEGHYLYVNRTVERHFARPVSMWIGRTDHDLFPPHEAQLVRQNDLSVLASGTTSEFEEVSTRPDGVRHYLSFKFPLQDRDGRRLLAGMSLDITDRIQAEAAVRQSEERLAAELEATSRLHALSSRLLSAADLTSGLEDVLKNAIETCGADFGNIQMFNPQSEALEIVAQQGFRDDFLDHFRSVRVDDGSACAQAMQSGERILIEDVEQDSDFAPHRRIAAAAGFRAVQSTPLRTHDGAILGMLSIHFRQPHRTSERDQRLLDLYARHAADLIDRLRFEQALRESDRRKDEFLATLAHELRNPLAPLRNGLQVLRLAGPNQELAEQARTMMERQLGHMVHLIDDLLDLSRISRGKIELRKERIELVKAIQQAVETSRPVIEQAGHDLRIEVPPGPIYVDADVTRLAQVFSNLLNNAAKYTERGGRIRLSVRQDGTEVTVSVRDNGIGIPLHMLPHIFEMFTQVDRNLERSQGGLGIGLSIVKRLVEMHGGTVEARSDGHGMGSEFRVRLPVTLSVLQPRNNESEPVRTSNRRRVLVVDDNRDAAMSLAMMLQLMGNEAKTAHDGLEALDVAAAYRPDLILLDIGMPRMNGYDTARHIRQQAWSRGVVLVALTGWGQDEDRRKSREAGFDLHMTKPLEPAALERLLASLNTETG